MVGVMLRGWWLQYLFRGVATLIIFIRLALYSLPFSFADTQIDQVRGAKVLSLETEKCRGLHHPMEHLVGCRCTPKISHEVRLRL